VVVKEGVVIVKLNSNHPLVETKPSLPWLPQSQGGADLHERNKSQASKDGWMDGSPGLEGGVRGEVAGRVLPGGPEDAGSPLLVAALGRSPGRARRRRHIAACLVSRGGWICGNPRSV
jgi:hypothetical protein